MNPLWLLLFVAASAVADIDITRQVSDFKGIEAAGPFYVEVDFTGTEGLRIVAALNDTNVTDALSTTVENGALKIKFLWPYDVDVGAFAGLIHIYVTAKSSSNFVLSGSGALIVNSQIKAPSVSAVCSGSGNISLIVDTKSLNLVLSGSGFINVRGNTDSLNVVVSGAGKVLLDQLQSNQATIAVYGAGDVVLDTREILSVVQMGSGTVRYLGDPKLNVMRMGAGSVVRMMPDAGSTQV